VSGTDNCGVNSLKILDQGTGEYFLGEFESGMNIKYTRAPRNKNAPIQKSGSGVVAYHLTGKGDMVVEVKDGAGNTNQFTCGGPPPRARLLRHE
jgi:hypothetical protein